MLPENYTQLVNLPNRSGPHHGPPPTYWSADPIFLTVCTRNRAAVLANERAHNTLLSLWSDRSRWIVGPYVLMPEHIHMLLQESSSNRTPLSTWIRWWKHESATHITNQIVRWQRNYWDTRIRSERMLAEKIAYIRNNPVKRNLVKSSEQWPFQGEILRIDSRRS